MDTGMISIIVAMAQNRVIGKNGDLPWHLKSDLRRFKAITEGHAVIMGRKTAEAILRRTGKPLPKRRNIVLTRNHDLSLPGFEIAHSVQEAIDLVQNETEVFVIGGAEIYALFLPYAHKMYQTLVECAPEGDVFFPTIDESEWLGDGDARYSANPGVDDHAFVFQDLKRKSFVVLRNARSDEQREALERIQARGECPFCKENLLKEHSKPILKEGKFWIVTENQWRYENAKRSFLLISLDHAERMSELNPLAGAEMIEMVGWLEKEYNIESGGVGIRFGDAKFNGGTVSHLHVHVLVPYNPNDLEFADLKFRMSAKKKEEKIG